jgi:hypothetical protein
MRAPKLRCKPSTTQQGRTMTAAPAYLFPAALHQHPSSMPVNPLVAHPNSMRTWRKLPPPRNPDIGISVPLVVAADPQITRTGRDHSRLNDVPRRPDPHDHLFGMKRSKAHRHRKQRGRQKFTHFHSPFTALMPTGRLPRGACFNPQCTEAINKNTSRRK